MSFLRPNLFPLKGGTSVPQNISYPTLKCQLQKRRRLLGEYDNFGRVIKEIDPSGEITAFSYNADGLQEKVNTPNGAVFSFAFNALKQATSKTSPDAGAVKYEYDISGNVTKETNAKGESKLYTYDIANRKTATQYDDASLNETYEYDNGANAKGKLTKVTDATGSVSFEYDANGNISKRVQNIGQNSYITAFEYDNEGKLLSMKYPSGKVVSYAYNKNEIQSLSIDGQIFIQNIVRNSNGIVSYTFADGSKHERLYDTNGRITKMIYPSYSEEMSYDKVSNITAINAQRFGYDALDRLTNYSEGNETQDFAYDGNANRMALKEITSSVIANDSEAIPRLPRDNVSRSDTNTSYTYKTNSNTLLKYLQTAKDKPAVEVNLAYDANGNLLKDAKHSYTYDAKSRLIGVDNNVSYAYNHENTRTSKTINGEETQFVYEGSRLLGEYDANGNVKNEYIWLENAPIFVIANDSEAIPRLPRDNVSRSDKVYKIYTDHLGTPRRLADETGAIIWSWEGKPFGESTPQNPQNLDFNLRFAGQYYDSETKTHYNINRDYNPQTGRYLQSDPIGYDGGVNSYGYVGAKPLVGVDEMGLKTLVINNGKTDGNPLGHSAIAFTKKGLYSFGTGDKFGTSVTNYVKKMAPRRSTIFSIINTTQTQENRILSYFVGLKDTDLNLAVNCAYRTSMALSMLDKFVPFSYTILHNGLPQSIPTYLPAEVHVQAIYYQGYFGGTSVGVSKIRSSATTVNIPSILYEFNK